jgi:hypothetical protein
LLKPAISNEALQEASQGWCQLIQVLLLI